MLRALRFKGAKSAGVYSAVEDRASCASATPRSVAPRIGMVNQKQLPLPTSLSTPMRPPCASTNVPVVTRTAHELKGSSYAVSAREMAKLALELEHAGEQEKWAEAMKIYAALAHGFLRVKDYLITEAKTNR